MRVCRDILQSRFKPLDFLPRHIHESWKQTKNGDLLELAECEGFDILITSDKNIHAQQNLRGRNLSIIVLPTNLRRQVMEHAADIIDAIN